MGCSLRDPIVVLSVIEFPIVVLSLTVIVVLSLTVIEFPIVVLTVIVIQFLLVVLPPFLIVVEPRGIEPRTS